MPIDPAVAVGARLPDRFFSWDASDVLLYHLALGAGSRPGDQVSPEALRYTCDGPALQVLPSFGVVAPTFHETDPPPLDLPGCDIDLAQVVHGSQSISVTRPLPTSGSATLRTRISEVWDKGKAAVVWQEGVASDDAGGELWRVRSSIFVRGEGGWGGDRGSSTAVALPDRAPDTETTYDVTPQQALLYRLCGDRNPLHADPGVREVRRLPGADPARPLLVGHRPASPDRRAAGWRRGAGRRLHRTVRGRGPARRDDPGARLAAGRRSGRGLGDHRRRRRARRRSGPGRLRADACLTPGRPSANSAPEPLTRG